MKGTYFTFKQKNILQLYLELTEGTYTDSEYKSTKIDKLLDSLFADSFISKTNPESHLKRIFIIFSSSYITTYIFYHLYGDIFTIYWHIRLYSCFYLRKSHKIIKTHETF